MGSNSIDMGLDRIFVVIALPSGLLRNRGFSCARPAHAWKRIAQKQKHTGQEKFSEYVQRI